MRRISQRPRPVLWLGTMARQTHLKVENLGRANTSYGWSLKTTENKISVFFNQGFQLYFSSSSLCPSFWEKKEIEAFMQESQWHHFKHHFSDLPLPPSVLRRFWGRSAGNLLITQHILFNAFRPAWCRPVPLPWQLLQCGFALSCWFVMETWYPFNLRQLWNGKKTGSHIASQSWFNSSCIINILNKMIFYIKKKKINQNIPQPGRLNCFCVRITTILHILNRQKNLHVFSWLHQTKKTYLC